MMKKKIMYGVISVVVILAIAVACMFTMRVTLDKSIEVRGYKISIPENWSSDSKGNFYNKKGKLAGKILLIDEAVDENNALDFLEEKTENPTCEEISKDTFKIVANNGDIMVYFYKNLLNPEPYGANVVIYRDVVGKIIGEKIAESFTSPQTGKNPPAKNVEIPENDENIVTITEEAVSNIEVLNKFIDLLSEKKSGNVDILEYKKDGEETVLKSWYSLESADGVGSMYSYYQKDDGTYTYDNNAVIFNELSKVISNEDEITSYIMKSEGKEDVQLVKIPLDRLRDNAKELIAMKTESADSEHVRKVMDKILTNDELKDLSVEVEEDSLSVGFGEGIKADKGQAYSQAAVVFGLAENIESVTVKYNDGTKYTFTKDNINKSTKTDVSTSADNEESFVKYTEEVKETQTQVARDGEVVYSGTVMISYSTMVTHPRTGERVEIGPYAEARGYGGYLGKPINCVIKRSGNGYIATATCGGSVIASYPLNSESELNWAKGMIGAY